MIWGIFPVQEKRNSANETVILFFHLIESYSFQTSISMTSWMIKTAIAPFAPFAYAGNNPVVSAGL